MIARQRIAGLSLLATSAATLLLLESCDGPCQGKSRWISPVLTVWSDGSSGYHPCESEICANSACASDADCAASDQCVRSDTDSSYGCLPRDWVQSQCQPKANRALGAPCSKASECVSRSCTDGTCANAYGAGKGAVIVYELAACGQPSVFIDDNLAGTLTSYKTSTPDCGDPGAINVTLDAGSHTWRAQTSQKQWGPETIQVKEGVCSRVALTCSCPSGQYPLSAGGACTPPTPSSCPNNWVVCTCPETHGVWCHPKCAYGYCDGSVCTP